MDIYEALTKDHERVQELLNELEQSSKLDDPKSWKPLLDLVRDELIPHSRAEEAVFYNPLRDLGQAEPDLADSFREHALAETLIRALETMSRVDMNWTAAFKKLREDVEHHIKQEESVTFAAARKVFSEEEARLIGEAFERLKPELKKDATSFTRSTIDLISNLLPQRVAGSFCRIAGAATRKAA